MSQILHLLLVGSVGLMAVIGTICILAAAELAWPRESLLPFRERLRLIKFATVYMLAGFIPAALATGAFYRLTDLTPLIPGIGFGDAVIAAIVGDFLYYWYHRAQHAIPLLWRIHAVHHSAEVMGAGAGYHHVLEAPMRGFLVGVPAGLIFGGGAGAVASFVITLHGFYVHTTTRLNFGRWSWLLCDNRIHRIHHSREQRHFDKNFGVITLVWDRLFGTSYMPAADEWPDVGLSERREPRSIGELLSLSPPRHISQGLTTHTST